MSSLRIHLFGNFRLYREVTWQEIQVIPKIQALLTLLLIRPGRKYSREIIANFLWRDWSEEQAHSCLNTAVWRLRKILEPQGVPSGTYLVSTSNGELGFNLQGDCWIDTFEFQKAFQQITNLDYHSVAIHNIHQLEQAITLYTGDLLEGCYDDWLIVERERLHINYVEVLYYLLNYYQSRNECDKAIRWGQQILLTDPLREDVHRALMQLYVENGQRALAIRQFHICRKILKAEFGIEPMLETQQAYSKALDKLSAKTILLDGSEQLGATKETLKSAMNYIKQAEKDLEEALTRLNK
jgi:DNA-binding SARP family transcriptional activator